MSHLQALSRSTLSALRGMYLVFTPQKGVLRALRLKEPLENAQGIHFECPQCSDEKKGHGVTLLFDFDSVPDGANPPGRYRPHWPVAGALPLYRLTIVGKVRSPYCSWSGWITEGEVFWKPQQS